MDDDVILRGPLGEMATAEAAPARLDPTDLYAGAISWWSAAVSPAVSIVSWPSAPLTVWMSHVHDDASDGSRLVDALRRLLGNSAPLSTHHDVTNGRMYGAAVHSTRRAEHAGTGTSALLLTGSPFTAGPGSSWRSPLLESHTRMAWDGRHIIPTRGFRRHRSAERTAPPHVGALWTPSLKAWRGFLSTDAATWSRVLHLAQRSAPAPLASASSDRWQHDLAGAYRWAFHTRPCLTYTPRAGELLDAVCEAEDRWDTAVPEKHGGFFLRVGDHVSRMAGALAAAERTAIHGTHIKAAWSLARRAVKDTCRLVSMDRDMVHQIVEYVDDAMRHVSTSEGQASPVLSNTPEGQTYGEYAHGTRSPSGINAVRKLKHWYQDSCQICATTLVLPSPRHRYSEAAHIRAKEDGGPDLTENLLCLCPNCHVRFDGGALVLTDDLTVVDTVKDRLGAKLKRHQWHYINPDHVRHHRHHWISRNPAPLTALPSERQSN
ncbi:HNH endonuclease [Streptomyces albogriseolus]|uniref:HNH endonuclease n=1 Tax=Streptomyces albogriseolus TaxID=1887 RepID=UPI0036A5ACC2